jgi:hypothetical protein
MADQIDKTRFPFAAGLVVAIVAALPFLIMLAWVFEEKVIGSRCVSWFCHAIGIDEPIGWLYRQLFE